MNKLESIMCLMRKNKKGDKMNGTTIILNYNLCPKLNKKRPKQITEERICPRCKKKISIYTDDKKQSWNHPITKQWKGYAVLCNSCRIEER